MDYRTEGPGPRLIALAGSIMSMAFTDRENGIIDIAKAIIVDPLAKVVARVRGSNDRQHSCLDNESTTIKSNAWVRLVEINNDNTINIATREIEHIRLQRQQLEIPTEWECSNCHHMNDNFTELALRCRTCGKPIDINHGSRVPEDITAAIMGLLSNGSATIERVSNISFEEYMVSRRSTSKSEEEKESSPSIPDDELAKEGEIACDICCARKATQLLVCCNSEKNVCDNCPFEHVSTSGKTDCPFCQKKMKLRSHAPVVDPKGTVLTADDIKGMA